MWTQGEKYGAVMMSTTEVRLECGWITGIQWFFFFFLSTPSKKQQIKIHEKWRRHWETSKLLKSKTSSTCSNELLMPEQLLMWIRFTPQTCLEVHCGHVELSTLFSPKLDTEHHWKVCRSGFCILNSHIRCIYPVTKPKLMLKSSWRPMKITVLIKRYIFHSSLGAWAQWSTSCIFKYLE